MRSNPVRESNAARRERLRAERVQAREIITQYRGIWQSVKSQLDDLQGRIKSAEKAGETVNRGWILKQSQLQQVQASAETEITIASAFLEHQITRAQADAVLAGRRDAEQMIRSALGTPPPGIEWYPALPTKATAQLIGRSSDGQPLGDLLSTLGPAAGKELRQVLVSGIAQGKNPRVVARDARTALGGNMARALTIARTEILGAYRASSLATYQDNADVVTSWVWSAAEDACEMCMAMQGEEFDTEDEMDTHPSCFPAGVAVAGPMAQAGIRRWYEGELVEFWTARGIRFSVTPNHPLLTPKGWVSAGLLNKGDYLLSYPDAERMKAPVDSDDEDVPALIEEVVASLRFSTSMMTTLVPSSAMDFHGDGSDSEIEVVRADSFLGDGFEYLEPFGEQEFGRGRSKALLFSGESTFASLLKRSSTSSGCNMRGLSIAMMLGRSALAHHQPICLHDSPSLNAGLSQNSADNRSAYAIPVGERLLGYSGRILTEEIIEIRRYPWAGHVYNLQTEHGWYTANSIAVHNCRCSLIPKTKSWADLGYPGVDNTTVEVPSGEDVFAAQSDSQQLATLGPAKFAAYKSGQITLKDLVQKIYSRQWGPGRRTGSLQFALEKAKARKG